MKKLKDFQEKAKKELCDASQKIIMGENTTDSLLIFKSPTGSGKTFTITKYIEEMVEWANSAEINKDLVFMFVSIGSGSLEKQSYEALEKELFGETKLYKLNEIKNNNHLNGGDVVVFNWEKVRSKNKEKKWSNIAMKEGDFGNLIDCLKSTKNNNSKIILIIDECHTNADTPRALELKDEIIKPDLTIEMSATPKLTNYKQKIQVEPKDVIDEGMIKKEIIINEEIATGDSETAILNSAFIKRGEILKEYKKKGIEINPLCVIQIPTGEIGNKRMESIKSFLCTKDISNSIYSFK